LRNALMSLLMSLLECSKDTINLDFDKAVEVILKHEGGYVNDKMDPGGETNMGISKRAYPNLDIRSLTVEDAKRIYYEDYWVRSKAREVPKSLRLIYFDMVVNMGRSRAVKIMQKALNNKGWFTVVDGGIGPETIGNLKRSKLEADRLRSYRVKHYADLVSKKPKLERYYYGWFRRAIAT